MKRPADRRPSYRRLEVLPPPINAERLAQARAYAEQFKFETLTEEDLLRMRRGVYKYAI